MTQYSSQWEVWLFLLDQPLTFFLVGACFGSFMNVVYYRFPLGRSVVSPGSACPGCGKPIAFYDNIPILAWIFLRGRCRTCGSSISWVYPVIEGLFALCFLGAALLFHGLTHAVVAAFGFTSTISMFYLLIRYQRAPWYLWTMSVTSWVYFVFEILK